ncbi:MAG: serine/threonine protein kinase [Verrucomicrobia bacterium]|nr:serine/threonine protein kinase [Verrucomicrobiota bacterium]
MAPTETGLPLRDRPPPPPREALAAALPQFEILELIGQGGMGCVFKARQPQLRRLVALKILPAALGQDLKFAARFTREAQALAALNHPHIVTIHDFGQAGGFFYLVMELVDGVSLRQLLREGRLPPETALAIVPKICEALQFAHERGVVHRDIKPENILLDKQGRVKIADFGIAKMVGVAGPAASAGVGAMVPEAAPSGSGAEGLTQEQVLGTPPYMAPEQVEHPQRVDHRADIYSLGVVFYEMLTGEPPRGTFPPPSKKVQVDVRLDEVVLRALEKDPERRYQQAGEVKTDVETIASSTAGGHGNAPGAESAGGAPSGEGRETGRPWVAWGVAITYAGTLAFGGLCHLVRGSVPGMADRRVFRHRGRVGGSGRGLEPGGGAGLAKARLRVGSAARVPDDVADAGVRGVLPARPADGARRMASGGGRSGGGSLIWLGRWRCRCVRGDCGGPHASH